MRTPPRTETRDAVRRASGRERGRHKRVLFLILAAVAVLYAPTLDDEWHLDDLGELNWPGVAPQESLRERGDYRGTLPLIFWKLDAAISSDSGISHHATNGGIHAVNAAFLYGIVWLLAAPVRRGRRLIAVAAALCFAVHPLASQTVAYVTQRSTSLAAACILATTLAWVAFRGETRRRRWVWLGAAAAAAFAGAHSKHVALLAPAFAGLAGLLLERPALRRAHTLLAFGVLLLVLLPRGLDLASRAQRQVEDGARSSAAPAALPATQRKPPARVYALTQVGVVATYARMTVLPTGLNLDHDVRLVRTPWTSAVILPGLALAALAGIALRLRRSQPLVALGIAWFFLGVLPTSSVIPSPDVLFEHRAYVSLAGFAIVAAALLSRLHERAPTRAVITALVLLIVAGAGTARRVGVWDSEMSLWTDVVAKSPGKARPHVNLGLALERSERAADSEAHYRAAVAIDPVDALALNNLGNLLGRRGSFEEADRVLRASMAANPRLAQPAFNLANVQMERGDYVEAETLYRRALELGLSTPIVRSSLSECLVLQRAAPRELPRHGQERRNG